MFVGVSKQFVNPMEPNTIGTNDRPTATGQSTNEHQHSCSRNSCFVGIFKCKNRSFEKPSGMFSNYELLKEIQIIDSWKHDIIKAVIFDNNLPMSTVAPFKRDHPMFKNVDNWVLKNSTKIGTLDMLLNAGEFHDEMTKQSMELEMPILGSSANTSLAGSKYNLDDIDFPVISVADILIDGGTSKYENEKGRSSTIIDFDNFKTIRIGVCYDKIRKIFSKFDVDLREDTE